MRRSLTTAHTFRAAALWLFGAALLCGPAGFGGVAVSQTCRTACPCDEESKTNLTKSSGNIEETSSPTHDNRRLIEDTKADDCQDECQDDCPNCGCCHRIVSTMHIDSWMSAVISGALPDSFKPSGVPTSGQRDDVFRPPRTLS